MEMITLHSRQLDETVAIACRIGEQLRGGEVFEFLSDLGGGKTTFVSGLAKGLSSVDPVASPSFTLNYVYRCKDGLQLSHFDFYRLDDAGIVGNELAEVVGDPQAIVAVEWGDIVHSVLPKERIKVTITATSEQQRTMQFEFPQNLQYVFKKVRNSQGSQ